ncbi:hypothetical protein L486_00723 [Kwoniella mangroviensis CBS 10435]|uniref:Uncharacterized protein n=1 Tax=Kwoniella mangroviensis CBS 10435 TaxID=1331196 RepID=A0A1B9IZW1_9TREE|nr:hypothetical protein L486_00723 [Kwoniella mangroviensis CBS 10435]
MRGIGGYAGWRFQFLLEGLLTCEFERFRGLSAIANVCIGTFSWLNRLPNSHLRAFRASEAQQVSNDLFKGTVFNPRSDFTLIGVQDAGHLVEQTHAALMQEMVKQAVRGKNYNPLLVVPNTTGNDD